MTKVVPKYKEKLIGVEYHVEKIPLNALKAWNNAFPHKNISIPDPNPFVPENLSVVSCFSEPVSTEPKCIADDIHGKAFFKLDTYYLSPEVMWIFNIKTPYTEEVNALNKVLLDLYIKCVNEQLKSVSYNAGEAGLEFALVHDCNKLILTISGYSDKAKVLLESVIEVMKNVHISRENFYIYHKMLLESYEDILKKGPLEIGMELMNSIIYKNFIPMNQRSLAIKDLKYEDFVSFCYNVLFETYIESVFCGNTTEDDVKMALRLISSQFTKPLSKNSKNNKKIFMLDKGPFYITKNAYCNGNVAMLIIEDDDFSFKKRAAQQIIMCGISTPFFAELRTKQQTGYAVFSLDKEEDGVLINTFAVQSNSHSNRDLLARFELFIEGFLQEFTENISEENFIAIKKAQIEILKKPAKNIRDMATLLNILVNDYDADFQWIDKRIQGLEELTYPEFVTMAKEMLCSTNKRRFAIFVDGQISENALLYEKISKEELEKLRG